MSTAGTSTETATPILAVGGACRCLALGSCGRLVGQRARFWPRRDRPDGRDCGSAVRTDKLLRRNLNGDGYADSRGRRTRDPPLIRARGRHRDLRRPRAPSGRPGIHRGSAGFRLLRVCSQRAQRSRRRWVFGSRRRRAAHRRHARSRSVPRRTFFSTMADSWSRAERFPSASLVAPSRRPAIWTATDFPNWPSVLPLITRRRPTSSVGSTCTRGAEPPLTGSPTLLSREQSGDYFGGPVAEAPP